MAVNKRSFYESINHDSVFNEEFFKKILGYSMYDKSFLEAVNTKLSKIGRIDVISRYNTWYTKWKGEDNLQMKKVSEWYQKECDRKFEKWKKEQHKEEAEKWKESLQNMSNEDLIRML
mgnify:CR=1 FL=1